MLAVFVFGSYPVFEGVAGPAATGFPIAVGDFRDRFPGIFRVGLGGGRFSGDCLAVLCSSYAGGLRFCGARRGCGDRGFFDDCLFFGHTLTNEL